MLQIPGADLTNFGNALMQDQIDRTELYSKRESSLQR